MSFAQRLQVQTLSRSNFEGASDNDAQQDMIFTQIQTIHLMILKRQPKGSLKGIFTLLQPNGPQGKFMKMTLVFSCGQAIFTNCFCACPGIGNLLPYDGQTREDLFLKLPILGYV